MHEEDRRIQKEKELGMVFWLLMVIFVKVLPELANMLILTSDWVTVFKK